MAPGHLIKRNCVTCPSEPPSCIQCPGGKVCSLSVQTCEQCPQAKCVSQTLISKRSAGAIAGGVVGGLVGVGIIIGIMLWYKFRGRRNQHLQDMKEAALEYDATGDRGNYDMQEEDEDYDEGEEEEFKRQSAISSGRSSNAIPIMFPARNGTMSPSAQLRTSRSFTSVGPPVIRDSIHDSEYSVESEYIPGANNQALREYDVAVQGLPNLIQVNKPIRPPSGRHTLGRINEGDAEETRTIHSTRSYVSNRPSESIRFSSRPTTEIDNASMRSGTTSSSRRRKYNSNAALPELPPVSRSGSSASSRKTLNPKELDNTAPESPFNDSASITDRSVLSIHQQLPTPDQSKRNTRVSKVSSDYVADLPDEATNYKGLF